jgi:hypothetical protein
MVETTQLFNTGVNSGAIDGDAVMVDVDLGWRLVEAPRRNSVKPMSLIFWEPAGDEDTPSVAKVVSDLCRDLVLTKCMKVGACIHGAENISPILTDPNADHVRIQCTAAVHNLKSVPLS